MKALVIPADDAPVRELDLPSSDSQSLRALQDAVGGYIEALPLPAFIGADREARMIVNDEGKFTQSINRRATDFMVPGVGLLFGDYIAGDCVLVGGDARGGLTDVPAVVNARVRLIEQEAA